MTCSVYMLHTLYEIIIMKIIIIYFQETLVLIFTTVMESISVPQRLLGLSVNHGYPTFSKLDQYQDLKAFYVEGLPNKLSKT